MLSYFRDEYEGIAWKPVVDAEVGYFSTFRGVNKKLSLMSPARDTRLEASFMRRLSRVEIEGTR